MPSASVSRVPKMRRMTRSENGMAAVYSRGTRASYLASTRAA